MVFDMLSGQDKIEFLRFYSEFMDLVELSEREAKPFGKAEIGDEDKFLLFDERQLRDWHLSDDNDENRKRFPIVAQCELMPEHEHDIISRWGEILAPLSDLAISIVIEDDNESLNRKKDGEYKGWYIEVRVKEGEEIGDTMIYIEDGDYSFM